MGAHRAPRTPGRRRAAAAAAALLAALACALGATPAAAASGTYVRLGQLAAEPSPGELLVVPVGDPAGAVMIPAVGYGELSDYRRIEPGDHVIGLRPPGTDATPVVRATFVAEPGSAYTLAATGTGPQQTLTVIDDDLAPPPAGEARIRVLQAVSAEPLEVSGPGGAPLGSALALGAASGYLTVPAGPVPLRAGPPGRAPVELTVGAAANQVLSVVLLDRAGSLEARVTVDADGPVERPPGPIAAGTGDGGDRAVGTAALGLFAVAAAGTAVLSRRRDPAPTAGPDRRTC